MLNSIKLRLSHSIDLIIISPEYFKYLRYSHNDAFSFTSTPVHLSKVLTYTTTTFWGPPLSSLATKKDGIVTVSSPKGNPTPISHFLVYVLEPLLVSPVRRQVSYESEWVSEDLHAGECIEGEYL
jgi:hypothetical protein